MSKPIDYNDFIHNDKPLTLDRAWLERLGVPVSNHKQAVQLCDKVYDALEIRVGRQIANQLSDTELDEFEKVRLTGDDTALFHEMRRLCPNYRDIVTQQEERMRKEIRTAEDKLAFIKTLQS